MVWHMQKMFNIAAGVVGAILAGWLGAAWAMTQFYSYRTTGGWPNEFNSGDVFSRAEFEMLSAGMRGHILAFEKSEQIYDWASIVPVAVAAALVGAFVVLLGVGILRKVYRT
jgi:uncharacterized membrane protein YeaQ/YmgE (transglycosylase-associated protein family)